MAEPTSDSGDGILISYRREDAAYPAGWPFDLLAADFGADRVFKDVDSIQPGDDTAVDSAPPGQPSSTQRGGIAGAKERP